MNIGVDELSVRRHHEYITVVVDHDRSRIVWAGEGKTADGILAYVRTGLSNGRTEALNGKIRTLTRRAYGFHSASALIALIFLCSAWRISSMYAVENPELRRNMVRHENVAASLASRGTSDAASGGVRSSARPRCRSCGTL